MSTLNINRVEIRSKYLAVIRDDCRNAETEVVAEFTGYLIYCLY